MDDLHAIVFGEGSQLFDCYPGGNDTFIFCNRRVGRASYGRLDHIVRSRYPHFEQGAVLERTKKDRAVVRVQTIGGDFSPNTVRSVAALIAELFCKDRSAIPFAHMDLVQVHRECMTFPIEVSGIKHLVQATVWATENQWQVELEMTASANMRIKRGIPLTFDDEVCACDLVMMEGLAQVLIPEEQVPFSRSRLTIFRRVVAARQQLNLHGCPAFGLAWWREHEGERFIQPVSYNTASDLCMDETGSAAAAIALSLALDDGCTKTARAVQQPSGVELRVRSQPAMKPFDSPKLFLTGPVHLRGERNSSFDLSLEGLPRRFYLVR